MLPLSLALATPRRQPRAPRQRARRSRCAQALREAFAHRSYVLLVLGYLHLRLPARLHHRAPAVLSGRSRACRRRSAAGRSATIGLFNIVGSVTSGWLGDRMPKRYLLSFIYFVRAAAILGFIAFPVTPFTCIVFGAVMGLMWLSTVPPTNGIIAVMFGTRWLATLSGFAFFSHQVGGFLGVWLGGLVFDRTGSYDAVWWLAILFGVLSALINLPIVEKPVPRVAAVPA